MPRAPAQDVDDQPDAVTADPGPRPSSTRGPAFIVAVSLAVLFAVAAAVLAVLVVRTGGDDQEDLRAAAGRFGEALVTYDYHDPTAHRDAVLGLATGSFRQDYQDAFDQGLSDIITEVQAVSTGTVNEVYLTSVDAGQARAIVSLDIEVSGTSGQRTLLDQYVLLTLIDLDGTWKVDQVTDLSFPTAGTTTPPVTGGTTTTTTAPAPTSVP
jgi:hypothetical protein